MNDILYDIDGYLTRHGYRRMGTDYAVWVPKNNDTETWPRAGDIVLLAANYAGTDDSSDPESDRYSYMALQWVPQTNGNYHWQVMTYMPTRAESWEEALWRAVMWAVLHKTSITLSALDLDKVTEHP